MKPFSKILAALLPLTALAQMAQAAETADCQILITEPLEVKGAPGEAIVASYFPAKDFIASAKDDAPEHISALNGQKIRALMCTRNDVIPAESDYDFLATGIPFVLSQDFDSPDTDSLTLYWKDGQIEHVYKGHPLSDEAQGILDSRLAAFSQNGLNPWARELAAEAEVQAKLEAQAAAENAKMEEDKTQLSPASTAIETDAEVINTAGVITSDSGSQDPFDAADVEEISLGEPKISDATKLNIQTKFEIEE